MSEPKRDLEESKMNMKREIPRTIFIKIDYLNNYTAEGPNQNFITLMNLTTPFVLITGAGDNSPSIHYQTYYENIIKHPMLIHWFAEQNMSPHPKISGIPNGLTYHDRIKQFKVEETLKSIRKNILPFSKRSNKIFACWRRRDYDSARSSADEFCNLHPDQFKRITSEIHYLDYLNLVKDHILVLAPNGNCPDPSPRAWECMIMKVIPIIKRIDFVTQVYSDLPCIIVDSWVDITNNKFMSLEKQAHGGFLNLSSLKLQKKTF
jgi:hypothetical protein